MPRPRKQKMICSMPECSAFGPHDSACGGEAVILSVEEFETVRLIDHEGLDQAQCAEDMGIARSTVQRLYTDARYKIAQSLVGGRMLKISGGDYMLCDKRKDPALCKGCGRHRRHGRAF